MLQWVTLTILALSCPIKAIRPYIFRPYIKEAEEIKNTASLTFSTVTHAMDEKRLHELGRTWYRAIPGKAYIP